MVLVVAEEGKSHDTLETYEIFTQKLNCYDVFSKAFYSKKWTLKT